ncbi:PAS domain S-box protein [Lysobacter sp. TY2-98]|uniref:PAS domain S-box protein n=1 Tax=Lysobacter sp. TY2-98 TaxID=2290922 RepID=UPI000E20ADF3|nr:PAS domain S-box protein [Lysobacter sp. TY2-98]AXK72705.1 PAS domain S-box protein [Lysobacter sp. TY2-98]
MSDSVPSNVSVHRRLVSRLPTAWTTLVGCLLLAAVYAPLAFASLRWGMTRGVASPMWPAAGVALAAFVLRGRRLWPGVVLGYVVGALLNASPSPLWVLLIVAGGNAAAAIVGQIILERTRFNPSFETFRDFVLFALVSASIAALSSTIGSLAIAAPLHLDSDRVWLMWSHWYLGDVTGVLIVGTMLLAWARGGWPRTMRWWTEFAVCLAMSAAIAAYVFLNRGERMYTFLVYCPLMWAALSLRLRGASAACLFIALTAVAGTTLGYGPFASLEVNARYLDLQVFIAVMAATTLVLAVVADERRAQHALMMSETRLRLALEASDTGLWKIDLRTGRMTFSPECARVTGIDERAISHTREGVATLLHPDDLVRMRATLADAIERRVLFESQFRVRRPDESELWIEARGRALYDADGLPSSMLGTISDITEQRRNERRLAEQASLLDLTSDAILIRDLTGRITYWNDSSERLYGYRRDEAIGRVARDLLRTRFPKSLGDIARTLLDRDRWEGEVVHYRKDGEPRTIHARWVLTRDGTGQPQSVMQTHTDITDRKRADLAAAFLVHLDRHIAQASSADDVADIGLRLLGEHLGLLRCTLSDIDIEQGVIRTLHEWTDGAPRVSGTFDAREFFTSELGATLASGESVAIRDLRSDPLTAQFADNYGPYGTVALAATSYVIEGRLAGTLTAAAGEPRDWRSDELQLLREVVARLWPAIERAKSVSALRESEARFRQMADITPMMVWVAEADGRCSYVSRRWTEFTGRAPETELGYGWKDVVHPDDLPAYSDTVSDAANAQRAFATEYRGLRWDGAWRWLHVSARPRFGAAGEFLGYVGAVMDVTERRDAEDALREADRRKDEFLATLAHELRNPLSPIRTGLQVLNRTEDAETARRTRAMMERQLGHMVRLIDDLLDVSRITSGKVVLQRDRISLQDAAHAAIESARPMIEGARHHLHVDLPSAPLWIDADPTRIAQVISNLLTNAAKYTPDGGEVRLRVFECDGAACVSVADNGLGIPPDALGAVFGMFAQVNRTLDRAQGGLGIGLALARRLVEMHGGSIVADSEGLGRGSTFVVRLPLAVDHPALPGADTHVSPMASRRRVLVVDDNQDAAETLGMMLELDGHATCVAYSALDGLRLVEEFRPEIAFLDIGMPVMNGYELARRLRGRADGEGMMLVAVSGWGGEADKQDAADAGFDLHLTKPVSVEAIQAAIARARKLAIAG